jgi:hypothetical protein
MYEPTTRSLLGISAVQDEQVYGLFPEFAAQVTRARVRPFLEKLEALGRDDVAEALQGIPSAWVLSSGTRDALRDFIYDRADFVATNLEKWLERLLPWQRNLPL